METAGISLGKWVWLDVESNFKVHRKRIELF